MSKIISFEKLYQKRIIIFVFPENVGVHNFLVVSNELVNKELWLYKSNFHIVLLYKYINNNLFDNI